MGKSFHIVAAIDDKLGLGKNGDLAWRLSADLKYFKEITTKVEHPSYKNVLIMGRKTWESIPAKFKPLPGRINVIITTQDKCEVPVGVLVFKDLNVALSSFNSHELVDKVFVIGGGQLYKHAIVHPSCKYLYITHVNGDFNCDVHFPFFQEKAKLIKRGPEVEENGISFSYALYELLESVKDENNVEL